MSNMKKLGTYLAMVALAILAFTVVMPDAYADDLTGPEPDLKPTDTLDNAEAWADPAMHTIDFTTATAGKIKYVDITFPADFDVSGVGVGTVNTISAGGVAATGQVVTYTVINPVNIPADTAITIELTDVVNAPVGIYTVTVETRDPFGTLDGPTESVPFTITSPSLANVENTPNPTTRGVSATHTIKFTTATKATIQSVDILFPAGFDVSGVAVGTPTGITAGTVADAGQVVTYTVTAPVEVADGIEITIPLTGVVNAPAGTTYTVWVATKDANGDYIDAPTESAPFPITAVLLTDVTDIVVPENAGTPATHTIGFTTATKATIKSVDITFPSTFNVTGVVVGTPIGGITAGTVADAGQVVTYTVTTPVEVAAGTDITIPLTGVVNAPTGSYTVWVATKDATPLTIDGPKESDPFDIIPANLTAVTDDIDDPRTGLPAVHTIGFTTATDGMIASVDITFLTGFNVTGVGVDVGNVTGLTNTVAVPSAPTNQTVTLTVTPAEAVVAGTPIEIPLTGVDNASVGSYTVTVETKDATLTIDGPTVSDPFEITPAMDLTAVTDVIDDPNPGVSAVHTIGFTTATTETIASVDITFPAGFDVTGVGVGTLVTGLANTVAVPSAPTTQTVTLTVTPAEAVAAGTPIEIPLTGVVNASVGTYTVTVATKNAAGAPIDGPTVSAPFKILTPGTIEFIQLSKYYTMPEGDPVPTGTTHYTTSGVFPGDFDDASEASANSKPDQVVIGALKKAADNVPLLKIVVRGNSEGTSDLESLTISYAGKRLEDIRANATLYEVFYHGNGDLKSAVLESERSITAGTATFDITDASIPASGLRNFIVVLDIASGAGSFKVDLRVKSVNNYPLEDRFLKEENIPSGNIGMAITPNPAGSAYIDASAPTLITSDVKPSYDTATKILTLEFNDVGARSLSQPDASPINVDNPRINVIDKVGDAPNEKVKWMVDLSKIQIRQADNSPSTTLSGASLLYPTAVAPLDEEDFIPADGAAFSEVIAGGEAIADQNEVKIKLTAEQDATLQQNIVDAVTGDAEIYINGALKDYQFGNAIAEVEKTLDVIGDVTSPLLVEEKPVSFDYKTQVLTLTFNESIDASEVELANIYIMNYVFDPEADADPDIPERIIVDLDSVMDLRDASVEEGYGVTVSMTLTPAQRDILKGDRPQVYLNDGAVEDIAGNSNDPLNSAIVAGSVDDFIRYIDEKYVAGEYPDIGARDAFVTPPILSGVESVYHGNLVKPEFLVSPNDYHLYDAVLDLKFTEELSTDVDATKITVTNENGEQPLTMTQSRYDSVLSTDSRIMRLLLTKRSKTSQKAKIAFWQLEDSGIDELHVEVGAGAVQDIYGNSNEAMAVSQRINWLKDTEGPRVTDATSYGHSSQVLKLAFDESIDLESDNLDNLVDLGKITLEASNGDLAGDSFTLNKDEDLIKAGQKTGVYLSITLSDDNRDIISSWDFAGGTQFILKTSTGAVYDIVGNTKPEYSGDYPKKNWAEDTVKPTFISPAFYSIDEKMLVLRFSEPIYDGDIPGYKPDLSKIEVHPAAEPNNKESLATATYIISGDALKIDLSGTDAALVDIREILEEKVNPQVNILGGQKEAAAVHDLAKNYILTITDRSVTLDVGGPKLSSTGNIYEHISLDDEDFFVTDGIVTVKFTEVIDGKSIKLSKIKLQAGVTSVDLSGAVNAITGVAVFPNADTFKMKIEDDDKVGKIASLQRDYHPNLSVVLEAEAIADLAGNLNVAGSQVVDTWTGDSKKPEIKLRESYYIHDLKERSNHYARLVLVFNEPMDTETIDASGVVITDGGNSMVTLTAEEIKPDQALSTEIQFNLTDAHRETISVWGEPKVIGTNGTTPSTDPPYVEDTGGLSTADHPDELSIYLAANSVTDTAGNSVVVSPSAKIFAKAAPYKTAADERKYDKALAADTAKEEGVDYSTWEQDLTAAKFVSGAYNANTRVLTVTFDEWMDVKPPALADSTRISIHDADSLTGIGESVDLAGAATENEKTKTVTYTLTTEKGVAVNALKTPLYIELRSEDTTSPTDDILDVGPARDIAGQLCERLLVDADTKISDTKDTTKPTLVINNGDDTTYRDKGKDFDAPDDITGLLSLVFNEGVDKDYGSIDASKIRLSNTSTPNSGFALTQDEIYDAAGRRVYPLAPKYVHIIQFDLNDEHWDTVAGEKWSTMYIHMDAGAISDTSGNGVAAVTIAIHDDHYYPDEAIPEVDITTEVSTASNGQKIDITATVVDDSPITEVRLYYQVGGQVKTYAVMENTSGTTYEGTIPGTAVTNKGLCYYVWARDLWDNVNITDNGNVKTKGGDWWYTSIPGGFNVKVTDTSVELAANMLPAFDASAVPSTYRMISVPIVPSPAVTSTDLFSPFGVAGIDWVSWKYTGGSQYNGYDGGHIDPFTFSPKSAAWIGTLNPDKALMVTGEAPQISDKYDDSDVAGKRYLAEIELSSGWNQIAIPFNFSRNWDKTTIKEDIGDNEYVDLVNISNSIYWFSGDKSAYSFASLDSTVPNQDVFEVSWTGSGVPDNSLVWSGWPGSLDPWGGYWIYSNREKAVLCIDPTVPGKGVLPATPTAPSVEMPYNWSVKVIPESGGTFGTAKFAGIVSDASDGIDSYDVMDLPALPGQVARLAFIMEDGDYLQDMKAPADEMFWNFKASSAANTPVTLRFDASAVPSEYRTVLLIDTVTEAATDLRKASSYAYKSSEKIRDFKLIISKAHIETYIVPRHSVLLQNYPNPFNPETWVPYSLSSAGDVKINVYNVTGQLVRTLELGHREAGSYTVKERAAYWDGRNATGERVASGVYFYNIQSGSFHATKRMVIVK